MRFREIVRRANGLLQAENRSAYNAMALDLNVIRKRRIFKHMALFVDVRLPVFQALQHRNQYGKF
ncbi:hypothetical protein [Asticcacaulis solisilvae]|uniref:hypothetical protein n=1 Tax=Asticcacaulis solisilvae TaxID=1217274 RepID=UPI003FD8D738